MNIYILDSWLREYLETKATPKEIAKYVSLCGPTFDRTQKVKLGKKLDYAYDIEVTANRVDSMSVYGIAREAAAILPQFGIKAKLKPLNFKKQPPPKKSLPFKVVGNKKLVSRTCAVIVEDIKNWKSPDWMKDRLETAGIRSLNSVVDITNYVMTDVGHPTHAFDYDKIKDATIIIRESKNKEKIVSLDNKTYELSGGDIIFQSTDGEIIDLPGIIGTKNSVVSKNTKRVLFFIDNNDPVRIRKSSMGLGIRTQAAIINEKGVDSELGMTAISRAIELAQTVCKAKIASKIYDNYLVKPKSKIVKLDLNFITQRVGVDISKANISKILTSLEFEPKWNGNTLKVKVPSFRAKDVSIAEDIVEEVARVYGYYKLPGEIMQGEIPEMSFDTTFTLEIKIIEILAALGGNEIYTYSLVPKNWAGMGALELRNPLGPDTKYLRTTLMHSLINATENNSGETQSFHLFEIANVYLPRKNKLPEEKMMLAGIFANTDYRSAKGVIESLLNKLNISYKLTQADANDFKPAHRLEIKVKGKLLGQFGVLENDFIYYEFDINTLHKTHRQYPSFTPIPKYPAQIEDVTLVLPERTKVGDVIATIKTSSELIAKVQLVDIYKDSYTFRIWYQDLKKTLTDEEVEKVRGKVLTEVKKEFVANLKA